MASNEDLGAASIKFDSGASAVDDYYNGMPVYLYSGPGSGQQFRIIDYVGSTQVAQIDTPYYLGTETTIFPSNTVSTFDVGHIPKEFAINDIAIVYREKSVK